MFDLFAHITPVYLLYLGYGAAFLFLGVSILSKDMKGSDLKLADKLWLLAVFGFLHGTHEWLELGPLIEGANMSFSQIFATKSLSAFAGILSFLFLLAFGISLLRDLNVDKRISWIKFIYVPLFLIWACYVWYYGFHEEGFHVDMQTVRQSDIGARYTFGFVGGMLTAYSLIAYSHEVRTLSLSVSKKLRHAGITFGFYAVFAGLFSSGYLLPILPIPVELLRSVSAFFITYFIANALNIFDIETRQKIEQQTRRLVLTEKLTSLGRLAAGIAHEINNPLTNASLGIQTLRNVCGKNAEGSKIVEKLDAVERNVDRASAIAQELLQFSKQREADFVPLNIATVIKGALTLMQYKLGTVTVHQDLASVPHILGDPGKLEQVFINVLSNSLEAMPEGGTISISTRQNKNMVIVQLSDSGKGIDAESLSKVFDPFFTTKEIGSGTGLGLSICYGIIKQHKGSIEVVNNIERGTTVQINLPSGERHEKDSDRG